jgi:hypothetical protein
MVSPNNHFMSPKPKSGSQAALLHLRHDVLRWRGSAWPQFAQAQGSPASVLPRHSLLSFSEHRPEHGVRYFKEAEKRGLEGIMAKRADSLYLSGI